MLKFIALVVMVQLFYGFGITMFAYSLPSDATTLIGSYSEPTANLDVKDISTTIESNIKSQLNIPLVDVGSLVFYSGNIVIDMLINFFTAIPSMITILVSGFFAFFPVDAFIAVQVKLVLWVMAAIIYFLAFLAFIMSIRSQGGAVV